MKVITERVEVITTHLQDCKIIENIFYINILHIKENSLKNEREEIIDSRTIKCFA